MKTNKYFVYYLLLAIILLLNFACKNSENNDLKDEVVKIHISHSVLYDTVLYDNNSCWASDVCNLFGYKDAYSNIIKIYSYGKEITDNPLEKYEYIFVTKKNITYPCYNTLKITIVSQVDDRVKQIQDLILFGDDYVDIFSHTLEQNGKKIFFISIITKSDEEYYSNTFKYSVENNIYEDIIEENEPHYYLLNHYSSKDDFISLFNAQNLSNNFEINEIDTHIEYVFFAGTEPISDPNINNNLESIKTDESETFNSFGINEAWLNWEDKIQGIKYTKTHNIFTAKNFKFKEDYSYAIEVIAFRNAENNYDKWIELCYLHDKAVCIKFDYCNNIYYLDTHILKGKDSVLSTFKYNYKNNREFIVVISKTNSTNKHYIDLFEADCGATGCCYLTQLTIKGCEDKLNNIKSYEDFITVFPKIEDDLIIEYSF